VAFEQFEAVTTCPAETEEIGYRLAKELVPGDVVALFGPMGAGKTAFVRGLARGLGVTDPVTSPTYTIVNEYEGRLPLFHFDMYRIGSEDELFEIGWEDYLKRGGVCAVEWSENIASAFDTGYYKVTVERSYDNDSNRTITIERLGEKR